MTESQDAWYVDIEIAGIGDRRVSRFSRKEFTVDLADIESHWLSWTEEEHNHFAAALACSPQDQADDNRRRIVDFLIGRGDPAIWRKIAFLIAKYIDRNRAVEFLLARVREGIAPLANYYQALAILRVPECVPTLVESLSKHRAEVEKHLFLQSWGERFLYLDFIACSATLLTITGKDEFRSNLKEMLEHPHKTIRQMVHTVAQVNGITI